MIKHRIQYANFTVYVAIENTMKSYKNLLFLFGDRVRYYRMNKGYTQAELSKLSGLHHTYIGQVERGEKNLCIKNIFLISNCLNVEPAKFFAQEPCDFEKRD